MKQFPILINPYKIKFYLFILKNKHFNGTKVVFENCKKKSPPVPVDYWFTRSTAIELNSL